ncbi:MAG TPA: hypothetical protein VGL83_04495 [Stellaceae bacterium]|jgi:hypothetical protein
MLTLALAGCGTTNLSGATQAADDGAAAIYANCDAQLRAGRLTSYRQTVDCARQPVLLVYAQNGYPFMDLVLFDLQERYIGAENIDFGTAKPAAVQRDLAELERRLVVERDRRIAARSGIGGSVAATPPAQLLAGLTTLTEGNGPPKSNNCFSVGGFTHCNSQSDDSR